MGGFDALFRTLGKTITKLFVNTPATLKRVRQSVVEETDESTTIIDKSVSVLISPPLPFDIKEVNGTSILTEDLKCYAPAKSLDELGFDPIPTSDVQIFVETHGRSYRMVTCQRLPGGDQIALFQMQLRI